MVFSCRGPHICHHTKDVIGLGVFKKITYRYNVIQLFVDFLMCNQNNRNMSPYNSARNSEEHLISDNRVRVRRDRHMRNPLTLKLFDARVYGLSEKYFKRCTGALVCL